MTSSGLGLTPKFSTKKSQIVLFFAKGVNILEKFANFSNIFTKKQALILFKLI